MSPAFPINNEMLKLNLGPDQPDVTSGRNTLNTIAGLTRLQHLESQSCYWKPWKLRPDQFTGSLSETNETFISFLCILQNQIGNTHLLLCCRCVLYQMKIVGDGEVQTLKDPQDRTAARDDEPLWTGWRPSDGGLFHFCLYASALALVINELLFGAVRGFLSQTTSHCSARTHGHTEPPVPHSFWWKSSSVIFSDINLVSNIFRTHPSLLTNTVDQKNNMIHLHYEMNPGGRVNYFLSWRVKRQVDTNEDIEKQAGTE